MVPAVTKPSRSSAKSPLRAAIYARYSSDEQRPESITDQIESCRRYCERMGWSVVATYSDAAVSGASTKLRPEYEQMRRDAEERRFDVLVTEALDRLSRRLADTADLYDRLNFRGIRLHAVDRGEISSLMMGMLGGMAQTFLEDLRHKTKRGQQGKILAGLSAGGISYGYRADPSNPGGRIIVPEEAEVVRRIFAMYADGVPPRAIAAKLNAEGVPSPGIAQPGRGRRTSAAKKPEEWGDTTIRGQVDRGTGILNNALYVGRIEWDRCSYVKDPSTGKRQARPRPPEDWAVAEAPELRIVDDGLWARVKARQAAVRTEMARDESGQPLNRAHRAQHLLSGLLVCGECGSSYVMVDSYRYGCNRNRSKATCPNGHKVKRKDLEQRVIDALRHRLMTPEMIEGAVADMRAWHAEQSASAGARQADVDAKLRRTEAHIDKIINAIAEIGHSPALLSKLSALEADKAKLVEDLAAAAAAAVPLPPLHVGMVRMMYAKLVEKHLLEVYALPEAQAARESLRRLIDRIVVTPKADDTGADVTLHGAFTGVLEVLGMIGQPVESKSPSAGTEGLSSSVVAGAGFEPAAFRL